MTTVTLKLGAEFSTCKFCKIETIVGDGVTTTDVPNYLAEQLLQAGMLV